MATTGRSVIYCWYCKRTGKFDIESGKTCIRDLVIISNLGILPIPLGHLFQLLELLTNMSVSRYIDTGKVMGDYRFSDQERVITLS